VRIRSRAAHRIEERGASVIDQMTAIGDLSGARGSRFTPRRLRREALGTWAAATIAA